MAEQSPRMEWAYPSREDDPWFDVFKDFVIAVDGSGFAHREDRSIIWSGGGTVSWDLGTETFGWTDWINVYSPMSGKLMRIAAGSITDWAEGEIVYVSLTRLALENVTKVFAKATAMPSNDDAMAFGVRIGGVIYLRTGISLGDGDSCAGIAPVPGGGGSALEVEDEGVSVDPAVVNMDFVGGNITATQTAPGHVQVAVTGGAASPFEDDIPNNEIQPVVASIGRSFIVGSQTMDDSGAAQDERMFFDKATGAFRAGTATSTQWDAVNRGDYSTAFGRNCRATSEAAFAEGENTQANGWWSHAEGANTTANGDYAHAEGVDTDADGYKSHAEGDLTWARNECDHAEGLATRAEGYNSHAEGWGSRTVGNAAHAEGRNTYASGYNCHSEGDNTRAYGDASHAEGVATETSIGADGAHAEGYNTLASIRASHAEGEDSEAYFHGSHAASSGQLSGSAHSQYQRMVQGRVVFPAPPWTFCLQLVGNNGALVVPLNHSWVVDIEVVARDASIPEGGGGTGDTATFFFKAALSDRGGVLLFVGGVSPWTWIHSFKDVGAATWDARLVLGVTTPNALEIEVSGDISRTTLWEATIHITEIESEYAIV